MTDDLQAIITVLSLVNPNVVKLVFPRGDAVCLLFGFNAEGKITGMSLMSMAGD